MRIHELLDLTVLDEMIADGMVKRQVDPSGELAILNYTDACTWARAWNDVTRQCRGLIHRLADGEVLARPWPKFFNYGEHTDGTLDLEAPVEVTDKEDGSLGILYTAPDGRPAIATRGSFASEQAEHATALYRQRHEGKWRPVPGWTYLFEIIYPANRIVLDYGETDDVILLGAVRIEGGMLVGADAACTDWPGPVARTFDYRTLADALAADPRPGAEGLVVRYLDGKHTGTMVKIKQEDYVALHRIVTGLTSRRIWEWQAVWDILREHPDLPVKRIGQALRMDVTEVQAIVDGGADWAGQIKKTAPEEFTEWIDRTRAALVEQVNAVLLEVAATTARVRVLPSRKDIAADIAEHPYRGLIFAALDAKPWLPQAWALVRPEAERPFRYHGEDVA